jgi:catalase
LTNEEAGKIGGENPDYGIQSLFEVIERGDYPTWTVYVVSFPRTEQKFLFLKVISSKP